jgi:hypothetical protein
MDIQEGSIVGEHSDGNLEAYVLEMALFLGPIALEEQPQVTKFEPEAEPRRFDSEESRLIVVGLPKLAHNDLSWKISWQARDLAADLTGSLGLRALSTEESGSQQAEG